MADIGARAVKVCRAHISDIRVRPKLSIVARFQRGNCRQATRRQLGGDSYLKDLDTCFFDVGHEPCQTFVGQYVVGHGFDHRGWCGGDVGADFGAI